MTSFSTLKHIYRRLTSTWVTTLSVKLIQEAAIRTKMTWRASHCSSTVNSFVKISIQMKTVIEESPLSARSHNSLLISERCRAAWAQVCWIWSPPCLRRVQLAGSGAAWSSGPAEPADRPPRRPGPASGWSRRSGSGWDQDKEADETDNGGTQNWISLFFF